jgi:hypothetical protein
MNSNEEQATTKERQSEGGRWLELLDEADLIGTPIPYYKEGRQLLAEEFTLIYDEARYNERVRPLFVALENLLPNDPKREEYKAALRRVLHSYLDRAASE